MPVTVVCPNPDCQASYSVADDAFGGTVRCKECDGLLLGATFAHYTVEGLLGRGGMGAVYLATDAKLRRRVALKLPIVDGPSAARRFVREARTAAALNHPNICHVFEAEEWQGQPYLTMAFLDGEPLDALLKREVRLPPERAVAIVRTLAEALAEAHAANVVHRDLKPSNVLMTRRGPVLTDFGLARFTEGESVVLTRPGSLLGTPAYMSPEQFEGDPEAIGPASDQFSLGVILYELLAGRRPFAGVTVQALMMQVMMTEPALTSTHAPGIDPRLDVVCLRALAKKPADRFASVSDLAAALEGLALPGPTSVPESSAPTPTASLPRLLSTAAPTAPGPPQTFSNSLGMRLVLIPPGSFLMGSPDSDRDAGADEKPQHRVRISRPFYLGAHPVTQEQYRQVIGTNPSYFAPTGVGKDEVKGVDTSKRPVERVSWLDAAAFCNALSRRQNLPEYYRIDRELVLIPDAAGKGYRLPTEAEWEYACRAGTTTRYSFGDDEDALRNYGWYSDNSGGTTQPVGEKAANPWGLYDMHGNVLEWCWDWFEPGYYTQSPAADPPGPRQASGRVIRGGGWNYEPRNARSANRFWNALGIRYSDLGFRVARGRLG